MRKNRVIEQNRCYHLVSRLAHRAFFLDDEEKDCAVALMRRVEAGVQDSMSYCINRADPFGLLTEDNLCRINSVKPERCRTFPFEWTNPDSTSVCHGLAEGG